jgi:protein arginine N-methyltransferase 1
MDCLGKLMYVEPNVESLDPKLIVTTSCRFFSLDLYTCQKEDAVFANLYSIKMEKSDCTVDGLVAWFDVEFRERLSSVVTFTTSPYNTSTHWKQTIFYIDGSYALDKGDELYGSIAIRKNKKHHRELEMKVSFNCKDPDGVQFDEKCV